MKNGQRLTFRKGDWLAIALVMLTAVGILAGFAAGSGRETPSVVCIYRDGQLVRELPLDRDARVLIEGEYVNTVTVSGGRVAITESDCPGRDCVHSGWIEGAGRSVVCLPNRVEIRVTGAAEVDFSVG